MRILLTPISVSALLIALLLAACNSSEQTQSGAEENPEAESAGALLVSYNMENLFDTEDDPDNFGDDEFLPTARKEWTAERYQKKISLLATALKGVADSMQKPLALIGVQEVENEQVVRDVAAALAELGLGEFEVVHAPSGDERGIDNALLYSTRYWQVLEQSLVSYTLPDPDDKTRATLIVSLANKADTADHLIVGVNHWPSRGNEEEFRMAVGAQLNQALMEGYQVGTPNAAPVVLIGDFNDEPFNRASPSRWEPTKATLLPG